MGIPLAGEGSCHHCHRRGAERPRSGAWDTPRPLGHSWRDSSNSCPGGLPAAASWDINNEALISPFLFGQGGKGTGNGAISDRWNYPAIS